MASTLFGILIIVIVFTGYYLSWQQFRRNYITGGIIFLLLSGLILRIYTGTDCFLHTWDERYHALVAKNLIDNPLRPTLYNQPILPYDYQNWTGNHVWLHKQPMPLWIMSGSLKLFGINEIALRLPSIILSTLAILLTFKIGSYFFSIRVGYFAAFLFSINGLIIELTGGRVATDHIDMFFLFFILLAVFFSVLFVQKRHIIYNILAGISIGAAILTKWLPALILLPIWILIILDSKKFKIKDIIFHFLVLLVSCIVLALPWQIYTFSKFPLEAAWETNYNYRHFFEVIEERTGSIFYYLNRIRIIFGELIYIPLIWFIWQLIQNPYNLKRLAILIWFLIPFLFFSIAKTKMQGYILLTAPALFLITAEFFFAIIDYRRNSKYKWIYSLILILLILLPVRYMIERVKPFEKRERNPQWTKDLRELNKNIDKGIIFNYSRPIEAMFYTNLIAYSKLPDKTTIDSLMNNGYNVVINDKDNIPQEIKEMKDVIFLEIAD